MKSKKTYPLAHEQSVLIVGKMYSVCHAKLIYWNGSREHFLPILPLLHKDAQFGVDYMHYHIDGRFRISGFLRKDFSVRENGRTNGIVGLPGTNITSYHSVAHKSLEIVYLDRKCLSTETGIIPPLRQRKGGTMPGDYHAWYNSMIGKSCAGKKCPHLGTVMIEKNGQLVCPMHNLIGCPEKEVIVPYTTTF